MQLFSAYQHEGDVFHFSTSRRQPEYYHGYIGVPSSTNHVLGRCSNVSHREVGGSEQEVNNV